MSVRHSLAFAVALISSVAANATTYIQYKINTSADGSFFNYPLGSVNARVFGTFWIERQAGDPLESPFEYTITDSSIDFFSRVPQNSPYFEIANFNVTFKPDTLVIDSPGVYGSSSFSSSSFSAYNPNGKSGYYTSSYGPPLNSRVDSVIVSTSATPFAHRIGVTFDITGAVPEASTWAMMLSGFGLVGAALRGRRTRVAFG